MLNPSWRLPEAGHRFNDVSVQAVMAREITAVGSDQPTPTLEPCELAERFIPSTAPDEYEKVTSGVNPVPDGTGML